MRLIDDKGKLLGLINPIDLFFLLLGALLLPATAMLLHLGASPQGALGLPVETELACKCIKIPPDVLPLVKTGNTALDRRTKQVTATITKTGEPQPYGISISLGDKYRQVIQDKHLHQMQVHFKLHAQAQGDTLFYNGYRININTPFQFETNNYRLTCLPLSSLEMYGKWKTITVRFVDVSPELRALINSGHIERDENGAIIAKLAEITGAVPVSVSTVIGNRFLLINDPSRKDITARMEVLCSDNGGLLLFKEFQIKVGAQIVFNSDKYVVSGIITGIEDPR